MTLEATRISPSGALLDPDRFALVHDYLTQKGGAERVALLMAGALGGSAIYTSFYDPQGTFPEFESLDVQAFPINKVTGLRHHHRAALPVLAPLFSSLTIDAEVVLCSSSGWAHGIKTDGRKIVYCHAPARWLYQTERYLGEPESPALWTSSLMKRKSALNIALHAAAPLLERWDRRAAFSADRYLANSKETAARVRKVYGIEAEVVSPPTTLNSGGLEEPFDDIHPGYLLCTSRLLPYKNVGILVEAMQYLPSVELVVVGEGPIRPFLEANAGPNVRFLGTVNDRQMRWLYRYCTGLVAASYEDYGLTPLEAATFGRPSAVLGRGGYLETVVEGVTGVFFESLAPNRVAETISEMLRTSFDPRTIIAHAKEFGPEAFKSRIREVVLEEAGEL